jgi:hypothetical protein
VSHEAPHAWTRRNHKKITAWPACCRSVLSRNVWPTQPARSIGHCFVRPCVPGLSFVLVHVHDDTSSRLKFLSKLTVDICFIFQKAPEAPPLYDKTLRSFAIARIQHASYPRTIQHPPSSPQIPHSHHLLLCPPPSSSLEAVAGKPGAASEGGGEDLVPLGPCLEGSEGGPRSGDRRSSAAALGLSPCPAAAPAAPCPDSLALTTAITSSFLDVLCPGRTDLRRCRSWSCTRVVRLAGLVVRRALPAYPAADD